MKRRNKKSWPESPDASVSPLRSGIAPLYTSALAAPPVSFHPQRARAPPLYPLLRDYLKDGREDSCFRCLWSRLVVLPDYPGSNFETRFNFNRLDPITRVRSLTGCLQPPPPPLRAPPSAPPPALATLPICFPFLVSPTRLCVLECSANVSPPGSSAKGLTLNGRNHPPLRISAAPIRHLGTSGDAAAIDPRGRINPSGVLKQ